MARAVAGKSLRENPLAQGSRQRQPAQQAHRASYGHLCKPTRPGTESGQRMPAVSLARVPAKCPAPSPELVGQHNSLRTEVELSGGAGSESPRADPNRKGPLRLVSLRDPLGVSGGRVTQHSHPKMAEIRAKIGKENRNGQHSHHKTAEGQAGKGRKGRDGRMRKATQRHPEITQ